MNRKDFLNAAAVGVAATLMAGASGYLARAAESGAVNRPVNGAAVNGPAASAPVAPGAQRSFADIIQAVAPAVVSIDVESKAAPSPVAMQGQGPFTFRFQGPPAGGGEDQTDPFGDLRRFFQQGPANPDPGPQKATGSGFFISADGYVVTNNHVVQGAQKITVRTKDGRSLKATVVGRDPATDLAVVKVEGQGFPFVSFEDRAHPRVGDWVVALGNPFGLGGTATAGIVSALERQNVSGSSYVDYLQIDAPINHGNSGGPTFDTYGRVVGVNTAIFSPSGGSVGIGFDIPADVAARVTRQLIANGKVTRGYIGATVQALTPDLAESLGRNSVKGALVAQVTPGGPSERAGLKTGDLITAIDGRAVASSTDLTRQVALVAPGSEARLTVLRDGRPLEVTVRAGTRPSEEALASADGAAPPAGDTGAGNALGLSVAPGAAGLTIEGVKPGSDAQDKGLRRGDVILRAGNARVGSPDDLAAAARQAKALGRDELVLLVAHGDRKLFVPVRIGQAQGNAG